MHPGVNKFGEQSLEILEKFGISKVSLQDLEKSCVMKINKAVKIIVSAFCPKLAAMPTYKIAFKKLDSHVVCPIVNFHIYAFAPVYDEILKIVLNFIIVWS
jgi:hypothetical protein